MHVANALWFHAHLYARNDIPELGLKAGEYIDRQALGIDEHKARSLAMTGLASVGPAPAPTKKGRG